MMRCTRASAWLDGCGWLFMSCGLASQSPFLSSMKFNKFESSLRSFHSLRGTRLQRAPCKGVIRKRIQT